MAGMTEPARPGRRRFQCGLGTLFVTLTLVTVLAAWLGWELRFIWDRQDYVQLCTERGRPCIMAADAGTSRYVNQAVPLPTIPIWRRVLGDEAVAYVGLPADETAEELRQFRLDCERLFPEAVRFGDESVRNALNQKTTANFVDTALGDILDFFSVKHRFRWHFDTAAIKNQYVPITTDSFANVPLHDVLETILEPQSLKYSIEQGELAVAAEPRLSSLASAFSGCGKIRSCQSPPLHVAAGINFRCGRC